ncbi:YeiH family protein [Anaerosalibacter sp. Marseille-P3206]|uniref:YeiH family protein n=1 Tax=Anaerosalibacter sp. Marseille-P3206 TaxID=1871005 RepID=UPI0009879AE5|nr:YeiH family protein [Anaerosalibacter sp. Marseille-P3206]
MRKTSSYLPGILVCVVIALISSYLGGQIPLVGGPVFALLLGIIIALFIKPNEKINPGLKFTSKKMLHFAIILLGFGLNIGQILEVGKFSLIVMIFTLTASFGFGYLFGKLFNMNWKLSSLISAGTGICGGSAIAALSPVIEADNSDITYAISATFIFDIVMIVLFPIMGKKLGLSDLAYGLWAGTAVNDTSSVVAAGYAYSNAAGEFATIVKLTRTLSIIPVVIIFSYINQKVKHKNLIAEDGSEYQKISLKSIFPYFIVLFILAAIINSLGLIPTKLGLIIKDTSKFFMIMALGAIGLKTDLKEIKNSGLAPMLHGFIISAIVVIVSLCVQFTLGQI